MSLPIPTTRHNNSHGRSINALDPRQLQAMDAPLIALTQQCKGDLRQLMFAFFSFLNRRTDFYLVPHPDDAKQGNIKMGFAEGDAEKMLVAAFRQFPLRRVPKGGVKAAAAAATTTTTTTATSTATGGPAKPRYTKPKEKPSPPTTTAEIKGKNPPIKSGTGDDKGENKAQVVESSGSSSKNSEDETGSSKEQTIEDTVKKDDGNRDDQVPSNMKDIKYNEEGLQIPIGNGGSTPCYKWTQTIDETTVLIGVPKIFRGKDYDVSITASKLTVRAKKCLPGDNTCITFVEGTLVDRIRVDESTWSVEGGVMSVTLDKKEKKFWSAVCTDDVEKYKIDTELVDSRRRIDEYDDATQAHFRKIIFDQNQYHLDGPSSDEILGKAKTASNIPGLPPGVQYDNKKDGNNEDIPELPPGVEYIDKKTLDDAEESKK